MGRTSTCSGTIPPLDKARYVYIGYTIQTVSGLLFVSYIVFCMCSISKYNTLYLTWSPMETTRCFSTSLPPRQNQHGPLGWGGGRLFAGGPPSCCLFCLRWAESRALWSKKKLGPASSWDSLCTVCGSRHTINFDLCKHGGFELQHKIMVISRDRTLRVNASFCLENWTMQWSRNRGGGAGEASGPLNFRASWVG